jgi:AbrB family looped-hinge helix DNA binding protein
MGNRIPMDKAGRIVLPKPLRDALRLQPGDEMTAEVEGELIRLRPVRAEATLRKELGVWVYQGDRSDASIPDLVDREREKRTKEFSE